MKSIICKCLGVLHGNPSKVCFGNLPGVLIRNPPGIPSSNPAEATSRNSPEIHSKILQEFHEKSLDQILRLIPREIKGKSQAKLSRIYKRASGGVLGENLIRNP